VTTVASILRRIVQRLGAGEKGVSQGKVFTAVFGKHPGWDDHIDDIGLDTDVLIAVKRALYIRGVGGNVDGGSWEKLEREQQAVPFGHVFIWLMGPDIVVGRLWPSQDGKGRASYPMVVCVQCSRSPLPWVCDNVLPRLERIETACRNTMSPEEVRRIVGDAQNEFRQLTGAGESTSAPARADVHVLATLARLPHLGPGRQGLHRILYCLDRESALGGSGADARQDSPPVALRVPVVSPMAHAEVLLWVNFLRIRFGSEVPILSLMPVRNAWVDTVIGMPTDAHLFCLRASLNAMPLTTSIPYHMDPEFVARVDQLVEDSLRETDDESGSDQPLG